ncbi:MAG: glycosyltransferase family 39 protein [Ferruginibacter sp.]
MPGGWLEIFSIKERVSLPVISVAMLKNLPWIFAAIIIVCFTGFNIDIMDVDAAQYASMSREMLQNKSYLQLYDVGNEYLDKPPFLIWISALSMKVLGINNFSYRLPSFLFSLLALYSTYKLSSLFYNKSVSALAALVLGCSQAFFLINHDVRTDTILMSCVIFSMWHLAAWYKQKIFYHFLLGCIGIAFGMMTKGPVALIIPLFAFGSHFILLRDFKMLFKWQYIAGIAIILLLLLPMCIGLYQQFDLHPEKTVNGKTGVSGLRFFFWTQSFGRITGESNWDNNTNIFFLLQNMLWSFLPWIFLFLIALFLNIKDVISQKFRLLPGQEWITTGGFLLTYLSLGLSKYQLPHYIFVVFPLAAIITAKFVYNIIFNKKFQKLYKTLIASHLILCTLLWIGLITLLFYCFHTVPLYIPISATIFFVLFVGFYILKKRSLLILPSFCIITILAVNFYLNIAFYPSLLKYQMGNTTGRWLHENKIPVNNTFIYQYPELRSLHFYAKANILHKDSLPLIQKGDYIITAGKKLPELDSAGLNFDKLYSDNDYHISRLTLKFLNPYRRPQELSPYSIIKIK